MSEYYLNFERTGRNPHQDRLLAISFHELDELGQPRGELKVLAEWEASEATILQEFLEILDLENPWNFIPVGFDFRTDFRFLRIKVQQLLGQSLSTGVFYERLPTIDLWPLALLMNKGRFKGTTLVWLLGQTNTAPTAAWYHNADYQPILQYIHTKAAYFLDFYQFLRREMPLLWGCHQPFRQTREEDR